VPRGALHDWKNVYVRPGTAHELRDGAMPQTQFGRMCAGAGIGIIAANSPQAKGQVERAHGTHHELTRNCHRKRVLQLAHKQGHFSCARDGDTSNVL
jgi:hypothetical protein